MSKENEMKAEEKVMKEKEQVKEAAGTGEELSPAEMKDAAGGRRDHTPEEFANLINKRKKN